MELYKLLEEATRKGIQILMRNGEDGKYFLHIYKDGQTIYQENNQSADSMVHNALKHVLEYEPPVDTPTMALSELLYDLESVGIIVDMEA